MTHSQLMIQNEIDRLRLKANMHREAAKTGLPFEFGGHTYAGDAGSHLKMARTLDRCADNLFREVSK